MNEKTPMKMKRVDAQDTAEETVSSETLADKARASVQPVRSFAGVTVVGSDEDLADMGMDVVVSDKPENVDQPVAHDQKVAESSKNDSGVVTVSAKEEEMEEVSYKDWAKDQKSELSVGNVSVKDRVESLVDLTKTEASKVLEGLKGKGDITTYRVMPMGVPFSFDVQPGRVQLLIDATERVIQVQIG